ncbi:Crp/Fnr family transcriptional regulator [Spongiivirga citrea]|uniref:Cyclic nucleotide-binding domain-containing protein n=1 Tax=Spongiivirga citrea TaxID=1481457 RepID=A0A6M0CPA1_9FLAO|nr:Crp/Fnr family transcriptional regulator [Spongiivirga citrea]NER17874.1 cyclic nucleotide-binding domain-containing protein [Spongiivirga citrea]
MIKEASITGFEGIFEPALLAEIQEVGVEKSFEKNDIIIDFGERMTNIPLVIKGSIKIVREDDNGNELLLYFLEKGDSCAMSLTCCFGDSKSKIRATAETDTTIITIPKDKMEWFMSKYDSWRFYILRSYQDRFDEMLETIDTLAFMNMEERLYRYLSDKTIIADSNEIIIKHHEIAEDLNTSRTVISRLLKKLEIEGKIKLGRNKIVVLKS